MEITVIKEENRSYFESLMPDHLWQEADLVIGAIEEETACGVLALAEHETTLSITYLYVAEKYRGAGIGTGLLGSLHDLARRTGIDLAVCQLSSGKETEAIEKCLEKNLFEKDDISNPIYIMTLGDVSAKVANPQYAGKANVRPLAEIPIRIWNIFLEKVAKLPNEKGTIPDIDVKLRYDQDASFLLMKNNAPAGCILLDRQETDYILSFFCVFGGASPVEMMALFAASYQVLKRTCEDETKIYINTLTETTEKMVRALSGQKAEIVGQAVTWYSLY